MSPLPDVTETINDGALGVVTADTSDICVKMGVSSLGTVNTLYAFNDKKTLQATLGTGPLVDAAALSLDVAGGPVYCVRITGSVSGSFGSMTQAGTGTATAAASGTPNDQYDIQVKLTRGGATLVAATAAFVYTLDGGDNWSPEVAMPTSGIYAIPGTGATITWTETSGTAFVVGDTVTVATVAPGYSGTDMSNAHAGLAADPRTWGFIHLVGQAANPGATATLLATLDSLLTSDANAFRYTWGIMECPDASDATIIAAFAASASKRIMVCAGFAEVASTLNGLIRKRNAAWAIAARAAAVPIHEDLGRVKTGPLSGIVSLDRDEQATPGLDAVRLATLRTIIGRQGFYITNGNMMAPAGSDFSLVQYRRVMDRACSVARDALLSYLNDSLELDPDTGFILETQARAIEADVGGKLADALVAPGHAVAATVHIDRNANISSTKTMPVTIRVQPLGYAKFITVDIGFTNPATALRTP